MLSLLFHLLFPLIGAGTKAAQQSTGTFGWREVLSLGGIILPVLLGIFLHLIRKKQEAENELRKQQLKDIKDAIKRAQKDADDALEKIASAVNQHLTHQIVCGDKFVGKDAYKQDMEMQSGHVASMRGTIETLHQVMTQQQTLVAQLVKTLS